MSSSTASTSRICASAAGPITGEAADEAREVLAGLGVVRVTLTFADPRSRRRLDVIP